MSSATLTAIEKALLPVACPLVGSLYNSEIEPALSNALKSASPEIQILESQLLVLFNTVVAQELARLATI